MRLIAAQLTLGMMHFSDCYEAVSRLVLNTIKSIKFRVRFQPNTALVSDGRFRAFVSVNKFQYK